VFLYGKVNAPLFVHRRNNFLQQRNIFYAWVCLTSGGIPIVLQTPTPTLVSALWERKRPLMMQRLTVLDQAAEAAENGHLCDPLTHEALSEAHKLAGSLGTFGFPTGTAIARELEVGLEFGTMSPVQMRELTRRLRETIFPVSPPTV
jgi:hypothetical protein